MKYKRKKKNKLILIARLSIGVFFFSLFFIMIGSNYKIVENKVYDISKNRNLKSVNLLTVYKDNEVTIKNASNLADALKIGKNNPVTFSGKLTGYGPDCKGCSGNLSCVKQNVKNGNIYYNDKDYGKIRILAGDSKIPCGTVIRISGLKGYKDFYAIVLDRGSAIKGTTLDLLFSTEKSVNIGKTSVKYTIVRWSWNGKS